MLRPTAWLGHPARPRLHASLPPRFPSLSVYGRACPAEVSSTLSLLSLLGSIINCRGRTLTCRSIKEQRLHRLRRTQINSAAHAPPCMDYQISVDSTESHPTGFWLRVRR